MKYIKLLTLLCSVVFSAGYVHADKFPVRLITTLPAKKSVIHAEAAASKALQNLTFSPKTIQLMIRDNPTKEQLRRAITYQQEYNRAYEALAHMRYYQIKGQTPSEFLDTHKDWSDFMINKSLNRYVAKAIEADNYDKVFQELSEYYGLEQGKSYFSIFMPSDLFAASAVNYMTHHPHKINLRLREVLESPYTRSYQGLIDLYTRKNFLTEQDKQYLYSVCKRAYKQYVGQLRLDEQGGCVTFPLKIYEENIQALKVFIEQTGRFPRVNAGPQESRLATTTNILLENIPVNRFMTLERTIRELEKLRSDYPTVIWTQEVFLEEYKKFVTKYPELFYPRKWEAEDYSEWDAILYDSYQHYVDEDAQQILTLMEQIHNEIVHP